MYASTQQRKASYSVRLGRTWIVTIAALLALAGVLFIWTPYLAWQIVRAHDRQTARAYIRGLRDGFGGRMGKGPWPGAAPSAQ